MEHASFLKVRVFRDSSLWHTAKKQNRPPSPDRKHRRGLSPDSSPRALQRDGETGFHQRGASRVRNFRFAFAVSCVRETRTNILFCQVGEFLQNLSVSHSACQVFKHIVHSDAQSTDAGLATAITGLDRQEVGMLHKLTLFENTATGNRKWATT